MEPTFVAVIVIVLVIASVSAYLEWQCNKERQEAYQTWAQSYNCDYNPNRDREIYRRYSHFRQLQKGSNRYAFDVLEGTWNRYPFLSFNFRYSTRSGKSTHTHYFGVVMIQIEQYCPKLVIRPKNFFEQVGNVLGFKDKNFESVEFSERFIVRCADENFAYDFCHPRMMKYLLSIPNIGLELNENMLILINYQGRMNPHKVEESLNQLIKLRQLMSKY